MQSPKPWPGWPSNQDFEDHLFTLSPLRLPLPGSVVVQYPPLDHVYSKPDGIALVLATYNFSIPTDGSLQIDVNGQMVSHVTESQGGLHGQMLRTLTLVMPVLPDGNYVVDVLALDAHGERLPHAAATFTTSFAVDSSRGTPLTAKLLWHCQRFLSPQLCE